jgi:hypothetical protein
MNNFEFKKYPKVHRLGVEETKDVLKGIVHIQEKIDGGNFRFYFTNEGKVIFGTRNQELDDKDGEFAKGFKRVADYILKQIESSKSKYNSNLIFYGEACIKHTINYDWDNMPLFLGFDIYDQEDNSFIHIDVAEEIFKKLGLQMVPRLGTKHNLNPELITDELVPISRYASKSAKDQKAEGVVFKNYEKQIFAKYVRNEFKERNAEAFGGTPKYNKVDDTDNAELVFKYCTNPRIEKLILKKLNEGKPLDMKLMGDLIRDTYLDIIEEEWREILTSNWKIDFKEVRKLIAPRCRNVLEQMINNNIGVNK